MRLTRRGRAFRDFVVLVGCSSIMWTVLYACWFIGQAG